MVVYSNATSEAYLLSRIPAFIENNKANVSVCLHVTVQTSGLQGSDRCADRDWFGWFGDLNLKVD